MDPPQQAFSLSAGAVASSPSPSAAAASSPSPSAAAVSSSSSPVDDVMMSDADDESKSESTPLSSPSSSSSPPSSCSSSAASEMEEEEEEEEDEDRNAFHLETYKLGEHCSSENLEMLHNLQRDNINMTVVLYPDYVVYRDSYCTEPRLTFSHSFIKISGCTTSEHHRTCQFDWGVDDLVNLECQRFQKAEFVMIKLRVISKDAPQDDDNANTSGIEELKIAVVEPFWSQKQERIASLNAKYVNAWVFLQDMDMETDEDDSLGQRHHFPNFDEPFEEVVYPKGDSDAVSISKRDVDLLQPETFINDTIIDFYIKYLKNQLLAEEKRRFHFFNSFFFRKMADLDKDPSSISDGRAAFQRVRKWTRKVDLFEKDYIFIPINFSLHWSLIVICHPGEVPRLNDGDSGKLLKVPCILHMDSIKGSHTGLKNLIQSYLWEEWKERTKETSEEISSKFHNLRFVPLELPQQGNSTDCGLFLLHYLELFLADAPAYFSPYKITKFTNFLNANWFLPSEASLKRTLIQRLIFELLENRYREVSSAVSSDDDQAKFPECNEHENGMQSFLGRCGPAVACQENISSSQAGQGIEITLLSTSSVRSSECVNDEGLVLREFFESGATAGPLLGQYQSFDQKPSFYSLNGAMPPIEEDTETGEHCDFLPSGDSGFQQITGIASQTCGFPYTSSAYGDETSYDLEISAQEENENMELSICASDHSEEIGVIENQSVGEDLGPSQKEDMDVNDYPSMENATCLTDGHVCVSGIQEASTIEGSQDLHNADDGNENHQIGDDLGPIQKDKMDVNNCPSMENVTCSTEGLVSPSGNQDTSVIEDSPDHDKEHDGNEKGGSQDPDNVNDGNENGGSLDRDKVHDGYENGGSQDRDNVHDGNENGGSQDRDNVHDGNENGGSQDPDKMPDGNENGGSEDHYKVHNGNENGVSQDHDKVHDGNENRGPLSSCKEHPDILKHQDSDRVSRVDAQMLDGGPVPEPQGQPTAKRLRLTPPHEDVQMFDNGSLPESQEQPTAKGLLLTPPLEDEKCVT